MGKIIVVLFSINTLLTAQPHTHSSQTYVKCASYALVFCVPLFFFHLPSLPDPTPVCRYTDMLPAPLSPPLSWHFRATREWCPHISVWEGRLRLSEDWGEGERGGLLWICSWNGFPFLSVNLFMSFHFSSIKSVCVFVGVQVHVRLVCCGSLSVTSS